MHNIRGGIHREVLAAWLVSLQPLLPSSTIRKQDRGCFRVMLPLVPTMVNLNAAMVGWVTCIFKQSSYRSGTDHKSKPQHGSVHSGIMQPRNLVSITPLDS
jgi:hypothetical protein